MEKIQNKKRQNPAAIWEKLFPPTVKREGTFITSNSGTLLNARRNSMLPLSQFGPNHPDLLPSRLLCDKLRRLRARFYDSSNEGSRQSSRGWRGQCHQCF